MIRLVGKDTFRQIEVVDVSLLDEGIIFVRARTWNIRHVARKKGQAPEFSEIKDVEVSKLWRWPDDR